MENRFIVTVFDINVMTVLGISSKTISKNHSTLNSTFMAFKYSINISNTIKTPRVSLVAKKMDVSKSIGRTWFIYRLESSQIGKAHIGGSRMVEKIRRPRDLVTVVFTLSHDSRYPSTSTSIPITIRINTNINIRTSINISISSR